MGGGSPTLSDPAGGTERLLYPIHPNHQ